MDYWKEEIKEKIRWDLVGLYAGIFFVGIAFWLFIGIEILKLFKK